MQIDSMTAELLQVQENLIQKDHNFAILQEQHNSIQQMYDNCENSDVIQQNIIERVCRSQLH